MTELAAKGIAFEGSPSEMEWGVVTTMLLPGDVKVSL